MTELEEGQWQCPDCKWYSHEPPGRERERSEKIHRAELCPRYERKRYSYDCKGRILEIRDGMIVVPYEQIKSGWYAVVIKATSEADKKSYPRGGYNIVVFDKDVETAIEHEPPVSAWPQEPATATEPARTRPSV